MAAATDNTRLPKRKQDALWWSVPVADGRGGWTFTDAIEIQVWWMDSAQLFLDNDGEEKISKSIVFPDRDVVAGEYLYLGAESSLDSAQSISTNPTAVLGAFQIRQYSKIPNINTTKYLRKAWL